MILMKEYVSLTTAAMEIGKIFTVIIATVAKRKNASLGKSSVFHVESSRARHPYLMDFFEIFYQW